MVKKRRKGRVWIIITSIAAGLAILIFFAVNPLLRNYLAEQVRTKITGNFYYTYDKLKVDLWTRSVTFEGVAWRFPKDTSILNQGGRVDKFRVSGISLISLLGDTDVEIDHILFENPELIIRIYEKQEEPFENDQKKPFDFYSLIKGNLNSLKVGRVEIHHGNATWLSPETDRAWRSIHDAEVDIRGIGLDSTIASENNGWFNLENVLLDCARSKLYLNDSLHYLTTSAINLDYDAQKLTIDSLRMVPIYNRREMGSKQKFQADRMELVAPRIAVKGIDLERFMINKKLYVEKLSVEDFNLHAYRDKNIIADPNRQAELPQLLLQKWGLTLRVDSVEINNATIKYEELTKDSKKSGEIFFTKMNAQISNITNDPEALEINSVAKMSVNTLLMGQSSLKTDFEFYLDDPNGDHKFNGNLGTFDLPALNSIIEPVTAISISSGKVNSMNFDVRLNNDVSDGKMDFRYSNLNIVVLGDKRLSDSRPVTTLVSFVANTFFKRKDNPSGNNPPRIGIVHFERDKSKSIFNFWWKSLFTGMKSTIIVTEPNK